MLARAAPGLRLNEHLEADGPNVFHHSCMLGLEGIVSKRKDSQYRSGRSPHWLKSKNPNAPAVKREAEEDLGRIPPGTVATELFLPFHHVGVAPVLLDQFADVIAALPLTARAFHAQHVKLPVNTIQDTFEACRCACATT